MSNPRSLRKCTGKLYALFLIPGIARKDCWHNDCYRIHDGLAKESRKKKAPTLAAGLDFSFFQKR